MSVHLIVGSLKSRSKGLRIPKLKFPLAVAVAVKTKTTGPSSAADANAKDLHSLERSTAKSTNSESTGKRTGGATFKPVKDKPTPPINFGGTSAKSAGLTNQGSNPYRGRLRQKHTHQ
jgi:hypothetical protein